MTRQIAPGYGAPSAFALEARINALERQISAAAEALTVLAEGLEGPSDDTNHERTEHAARQAHELLLHAGFCDPPSR
jgi:hypothetical protein